MWHISRREDRLAVSQRHPVVPNFKENLSLYHVEPLVLVQMDVARWAAFLAGRMLDDEQLSICVSRRDLEGDRCNTEIVAFAETVQPDPTGRTGGLNIVARDCP